MPAPQFDNDSTRSLHKPLNLKKVFILIGKQFYMLTDTVLHYKSFNSLKLIFKGIKGIFKGIKVIISYPETWIVFKKKVKSNLHDTQDTFLFNPILHLKL